MTQTTLHPTHIEFHGQQIAVFPKDDHLFVSVRHVCENIGLSVGNQIEKIKKSQAFDGFRTAISTETPKGERDTFCLHLDALPLWLGSIQTHRVKEEIRPALIRYQRECMKVLRDHFFGTTTNRPLLSENNAPRSSGRVLPPPPPHPEEDLKEEFHKGDSYHEPLKDYQLEPGMFREEKKNLYERNPLYHLSYFVDEVTYLATRNFNCSRLNFEEIQKRKKYENYFLAMIKLMQEQIAERDSTISDMERRVKELETRVNAMSSSQNKQAQTKSTKGKASTPERINHMYSSANRKRWDRMKGKPAPLNAK
jgi:hypothetical protein